MRIFRFLSLLALAAGACVGQSWEVGVAGGYSFYRDATIRNPPLSAQAGFQSGGVGSAEIGEDVGRFLGGEFRYTFIDGDARLRFGGQQVTFGTVAHAVHYDLLVYATPKGSKVRPYVSAGGGIKYYVGNGRETAVQPLANFAFLTHANEVEGLFAAGAGVKVHIDEHWLVRVDFRYYLTPFPQKIFVPAPGASSHGWLNNFVPLAGIAWTF
jgi:Outer membrane protein beta-barrel domain